MGDVLTGACLGILDHNLGLRESERLLLVADRSMTTIADAFEAAARRITTQVRRVEIPVAGGHGEEPPAPVATLMASTDVVLLPLARSISWTRARMAATAAGARVASMPAITVEALLRTFGTDFRRVRERSNLLCDRLDAGSEVRVRSAAGTDLFLSIAGRAGHGRKGGLYRRPGEWGNLPCGEAFVAPVEGTAQGVYVVDASHGGVGRVDQPIRLSVRDGLVARIEGGDAASRLAAMLASVGEPPAYNVAEFGIGCNHRARVCGVTLEDEKALGTCHLAVGGNEFFGGTVSIGLHLDGVIRDPSISIDGAAIMERGRLAPDLEPR